MFRHLFVFIFAAVCSVWATDLDTYVWAPDANFGWTDMGDDLVITGSSLLWGNNNWTGYAVNMTSQKWLTDDVFSVDSPSKSIWWHMMYIVVPSNVDYKNNATLYITGWGMDDNWPTADDEDIVLAASLAMGTRTIVGCLFQIPNEHTIFADDPLQKSRSEDAIIAYTWDHFLKNPEDTQWLLRFPMVKASLRAMDTITAFVAAKFPEEGYSLDYYTVMGASKRGWTTWDVGAVDPTRVMAIVPIVLDAINFVEVMHHQYKSYGGWSSALHDYWEMNITSRFDDPNMALLQEQVDPFWYRERLTMPKLVVNGGFDEFQQPDDSRYWFDALPPNKHLLMVPNADHGMGSGLLEAVPAIGTWVAHLLRGYVVPEFKWSISEEDGSVSVTLDGQAEVKEATVWWATSCGHNVAADGTVTNRRDFRLSNLDSPCQCGLDQDGSCLNLKSRWSKETLNAVVDAATGVVTYTAHREAPTDGRYVAYFIDIKYSRHHTIGSELDAGGADVGAIHKDRLGKAGGLPRDRPGQLEFTTGTSIWPNTFPYEDCSGVSCQGVLV